jgi:hypothetical protein
MMLPVALAMCGPTPQVEVATISAWEAGGTCRVRASVRRLDPRLKGPLLIWVDAGDDHEAGIGYADDVAWLSRRPFAVQFEFLGIACREIHHMMFGVPCRPNLVRRGRSRWN